MDEKDIEALKAQIAEQAAKIEQLNTGSVVMYRCPGALVVADGVESRETCDFTGPSLTCECPTHGTHVQ